MNSLMGDSEAPKPDNSSSADAMKSFAEGVQQIDQQLKDYARQYPDFSPFAKAACDAIAKGLPKVIGGMGRQGEAPAPQVAY